MIFTKKQVKKIAKCAARLEFRDIRRDLAHALCYASGKNYPTSKKARKRLKHKAMQIMAYLSNESVILRCFGDRAEFYDFTTYVESGGQDGALAFTENESRPN